LSKYENHHFVFSFPKEFILTHSEFNPQPKLPPPWNHSNKLRLFFCTHRT